MKLRGRMLAGDDGCSKMMAMVKEVLVMDEFWNRICAVLRSTVEEKCCGVVGRLKIFTVPFSTSKYLFIDYDLLRHQC
jgi:hypothetical protein